MAGSLWERIKSPAFFSTVLWSICSVSMILLNKLILTTFSFRFNCLLLIYQNALCVVMMYIGKVFGMIDFEPLTRDKVIHWIPLDIFFVLMLWTGTYSLKYLSVPMVTVFKNSTNIAITFFDFIIYRNNVSNGVVGSLSLMLLAAILASIEDLEFSLIGYIWTFINCAFNTAFVLYMPRAMSKSQLSPLGKVYYNNLLSLPLLVVLDLVSNADIIKVARAGWSDWPLELHVLLFLSGIMGFALSGSAFHCMQHTSPTTYSLVGSINKIPLTVLGVMLFNTVLTGPGMVYVGISLLAAGVFGYSKAVEKEKKVISVKSRPEEKESFLGRKDSIESGNMRRVSAERPRRRTSSTVKKMDE